MSSFDVGVDRKGTACIKWDFQRADYGRDGLLPFSIADADYSTAQPILDALKERIDNGVIGYTDLEETYLQAVADWCSRRHQWNIEKDWIVPTGGIVPAMCNAIEALLQPEDGVIIQPPVYDPFYSIIQASGRTLVKNDLLLDENGYHMDYEGFEQACRQGARMLLLCSPHNPVCRVWSYDELKKLSDICEKYDIYVVSDEIHWDLIMGEQKHVTMGQFPALYEKLIVCTSASKSFNVAGLDTSNLIIPGDRTRETYRNWLFARYLFCPNALGMTAVKAAYQKGEGWLEECLSYLKENIRFVSDFLKEHLPKVQLADPQGTFLLWMDMTAYGKSGRELVELIAEEGAGLNDGKQYGDAYDGFLRMNVACPRKQLEEGLLCVERALNKIN